MSLAATMIKDGLSGICKDGALEAQGLQLLQGLPDLSSIFACAELSIDRLFQQPGQGFVVLNVEEDPSGLAQDVEEVDGRAQQPRLRRDKADKERPEQV